MKVLFDHDIPKNLLQLLPGHSIITSRELRWDALKNGELLTAAKAHGFDVMATGDKKLAYQQNLKVRKPALIVSEETDWNILKQEPGPVAAALENAQPGSFQRITFEQSRKRDQAKDANDSQHQLERA